MGSRNTLAGLFTIVALSAAHVGCGSDGSTTDGGDGGHRADATTSNDGAGGSSADAGGGPAGPADASLTPGIFGRAPDGGQGSCLGFGAGCAAAIDCCGGDCTGGVCKYPACTSDHGACTGNGNCCSQSCVGGACAPLNATCKTLGNQCASGADCCSKLCSNGTCQASSFCGQAGDGCSTGADCCTGTCALAAGATLGTCGVNPPGGPANCGVVDGQLCGGGGTTADGGVLRNDAGLPACGGACCSRACAPWGPTGALICQPASGCHVVGDLCTTDTDCCGSAGLPGGSGKPVTCVITAPSLLGVCRNPMGCKPDGDVCKLKTMSCNSSCDCCAGNCETKDTCKQDNVGVPRCAPAQCAAVGAACASSASCCGGAPCVPNPADGGTPPYVCSGTACIPACGSCTNNADCCAGTSCVVGPGSVHGVCGPCVPTGSDAGAGPGDAGRTGDDAAAPPDAGTGVPACALYGQICTASSQCCDGVPCTNGRCAFPPTR